ncbi:MAG: ribosome maturation factor RimP [Deltaproteobacteria bacterium]|nr:MAG: ribosome maturation factor RimP [Deltaproteobacteria bacterium]
MDLNKIQTLVEPVLKEIGCEWVEGKIVFEHGRRILRLLVDKEGGVTVGDCEKVSREVGVLLDVEGAVDDRYVLEVSSPGINRPLVKEADYQKFLGKMASIKTREPIDGRRNYKGVLQKLENSEVEILIDGKIYRVPLALVEKAKLVEA